MAISMNMEAFSSVKIHYTKDLVKNHDIKTQGLTTIRGEVSLLFSLFKENSTEKCNLREFSHLGHLANVYQRSISDLNFEFSIQNFLS